MVDYRYSKDEIKAANVISLRPDEAFELMCGETYTIFATEVENTAAVRGLLVIHSAEVDEETKVLAEHGAERMGVTLKDMAPGCALGWCEVVDCYPYTADKWSADLAAGKHNQNTSLDIFCSTFGIEGKLYGYIVRKQMMLINPVGMKGGTMGFWQPETPFDSAAVRKVFDANREAMSIEELMQEEAE